MFFIGTSVLTAPSLAPIAIGAGLTTLVYMGGHISGAHYNPVVTVAMYLERAMPRTDVVPYLLVQILGGLAAAAAVAAIMGATFAPAPAPDRSIIAALMAEALMTFALVLVILNVATSRTTEGNGYYGVAIGFTVLAGAYAVGPVSGAALNPAVGTGLIVVDVLTGDGSFADLWLYWVAPTTGGLLAVPVFRLQEAGR